MEYLEFSGSTINFYVKNYSNKLILPKFLKMILKLGFLIFQYMLTRLIYHVRLGYVMDMQTYLNRIKYLGMTVIFSVYSIWREKIRN